MGSFVCIKLRSTLIFKLIDIYKDYSFEEYVDLLLEENKSKDYPNIDSVE